jgi:hypothetical protein
MQAKLAEWQAKVICTFVGAAGMVESSGGKNPLVEAAREIDIFAGQHDDERQKELDRIRGDVVAEDWRDDPRFAPVAASPDAGVEASNPAGSFENFMRAFDPSGSHLQAVPDLPAEDP